MITIVLDLLLALASGCIGFAASCYLLRRTAVAPEPINHAEVAQHAMAQLQQLTKRIADDVVDHNSRVREISDSLGGADQEVTADHLASAVTALIHVNETMQEQLASAERRLQDQAREIETHVAEARTDALTGLNNRRVFDTEMERGYSDYHRRGRPISLMLADVDHFKAFNDTHGHQAGDEVLRAVARVLSRQMKADQIVCRYGGEEFALIFPGATVNDAAATAERARQAIGEMTVEFEGKTLRVTASGGLAQLRSNESLDEFIRRADEALYASKEEGRNCAHGHDGERFYPLEALLDKIETPPKAEPQPATPPPHSASNETLEERLDRLTGLSTMEAFRNDLDRRLSEVKRSGQPLSLLVAEIDNLELIRLQFGDKNAAMVLRAGAQFFKATMREMDHLARFDDDSFALLLPTASLENAKTVAERLRGAVYRCKLPLGGRSFQFTMSFGVAQAAPNEGTESLLRRCMAAQRRAAEVGGNRCHAAEPTAAELDAVAS